MPASHFLRTAWRMSQPEVKSVIVKGMEQGIAREAQRS
jgi:hypothetical protein